MSSPREPRVAVVGATGAVGNEIVELLAARGFPHSRLTLFASHSGAAGTVETAEDEYLVEALRDPEDLAEFDLAFLAIPESAATEITSAMPGPVLIDLSGATRSPSNSIPMVAPGVTSRDRIAELGGGRLFTIPHPAAHVLTLCLDALKPAAAISTVLSGASAGGRGSIARLVDQTTDLLSARLDLADDETQRSFNAFVRETERATADRIAAQVLAMTIATVSSLNVQMVSVPILHGTGLTIAARLQTAGDEWLESLRATPGVLLMEEGQALSVIDAVGQEAIEISAERTGDTANLWCVFDNTRLAALAAVWTAETFAIGAPAAN